MTILMANTALDNVQELLIFLRKCVITPFPFGKIHFEHLSDLKGIYNFSYLSVEYESSVKFFIIDFTSDDSMTGGNMVLVVQERRTYWTNGSPSEFCSAYEVSCLLSSLSETTCCRFQELFGFFGLGSLLFSTPSEALLLHPCLVFGLPDFRLPVLVYYSRHAWYQA